MGSTIAEPQGDEDWRLISDPKRRKRVQNRLAQRKRRQKCRPLYTGGESETSGRASSFGESFDHFGTGDISVDPLQFSPRSQNDVGDPLLEPEPGPVEDLFLHDFFPADSFEGRFDSLYATEIEDKRQSAPQCGVSSTCCCGQRHTDTDNLIAPRHTPPGSPRRRPPLPLPLSDSRESHSLQSSHSRGHATSDAYTDASRPHSVSSARAPSIENGPPVSMHRFSKRSSRASPTLVAPATAERRQPFSTRRASQPSYHSQNQGGSRRRMASSDQNCDHLECRQHSPPTSPQQESSPQYTRRESSAAQQLSRPKVAPPGNHDILAEYGIDLPDILRKASNSRRQSQSRLDGDNAGLVPRSSSRSQRGADRATEAPSAPETEARCDMVVIVYLQRDGVGS